MFANMPQDFAIANNVVCRHFFLARYSNGSEHYLEVAGACAGCQHHQDAFTEKLKDQRRERRKKVTWGRQNFFLYVRTCAQTHTLVHP